MKIEAARRETMSNTNPFVLAELVTQLEELSRAVQVLGKAPVANDNAKKLRPFKAASAELRKAAHNAGRQAQRRLSKKNPAYTKRYKDAYDGYLNSEGFRGKYQERAAQAAKRAA
jgi:hypothetical protein